MELIVKDEELAEVTKYLAGERKARFVFMLIGVVVIVLSVLYQSSADARGDAGYVFAAIGAVWVFVHYREKIPADPTSRMLPYGLSQHQPTETALQDQSTKRPPF